jgi:hypothetical protein
MKLFPFSFLLPTIFSNHTNQFLQKQVTQDVETMKMKEQKLEPIALDKKYKIF